MDFLCSIIHYFHLMKYCTAIAILFFFLQSYSQDLITYKKDSTAIADCPKAVIHLSDISHDSTTLIKQLPFQSFRVRDFRADTSSLGVQFRSAEVMSRKYFNKIVLNIPATSFIETYLNDDANNKFTTSESSLICFIKQLRLTQIDTFNKNTNDIEIYNKINFEVEAYLYTNDVYHPALRIDTIMSSRTNSKYAFEVISDVLDLFAEKASKIDTTKVLSRTAYTLSALITKYNQRFDKPILTATRLNKGIYRSLSEFMNNAPSIKDYTFETYKKTISLYSKGAYGHIEPVAKPFGFCDGGIIWINSNNIFHPLIRSQNTFEFLGDYFSVDYRDGSHLQSGLLSNNLLVAVGSSIIANANNSVPYGKPKGKIIRQLDVDKGEFY